MNKHDSEGGDWKPKADVTRNSGYKHDSEGSSLALKPKADVHTRDTSGSSARSLVIGPLKFIKQSHRF